MSQLLEDIARGLYQVLTPSMAYAHMPDAHQPASDSCLEHVLGTSIWRRSILPPRLILQPYEAVG